MYLRYSFSITHVSKIKYSIILFLKKKVKEFTKRLHISLIWMYRFIVVL